VGVVSSQRWIHSRAFDSWCIIAPQFIVAICLLIWSDSARAFGELPPWLWVVLIVGVDVSHVYSTVFRTYLDPRERARMPNLYKLFPVVSWVLGVVVYSCGSLYFWRAMAYLAVFHFVRQQYGFMMIYASRNRTGSMRLDKAAIYSATLYPLVYWHCHERDFHWFVEKDFLSFRAPMIAQMGLCIYAGILVSYLLAEVRSYRSAGKINLPKNLLLVGTALTWWVGIVTFNNDIAFTATNVIAHGVPYLALIWLYKMKEAKLDRSRPLFFRTRGIPSYLAALFVVAFIEEAFWDGLVWRDHQQLFSWAWSLGTPSETMLAMIVPLLILPQVLHYVFDAFLWRLHEGDPRWKTVLLGGIVQ
jgi:hypothetical protein